MFMYHWFYLVNNLTYIMYIRCNLLYTHNVFQIKLKWYFKCKKKLHKNKTTKILSGKNGSTIWTYFLLFLSQKSHWLVGRCSAWLYQNWAQQCSGRLPDRPAVLGSVTHFQQQLPELLLFAENLIQHIWNGLFLKCMQ